MRIGVLTLPLHTNYGGILQAYALQTVLERLGHQVNVLNCSQVKSKPSKWFLVYLIRIIKKIIFGRKLLVFAEQFHNKYYPEISKKTQAFIETYINQRIIQSLNDIKCNDYDAIVVGSDQIWNPSYFRRLWNSTMENAFLNFTDKWNLKRIAYAASFGCDMWNLSSRETAVCKKMIQKFSCVSVREKSGVEICKKYFGVFADLVPDPTLLLNKEDYLNLVEKAKVNKSTGNLLCYILDDSAEKRELVKIVADDRNLIPFKVNSKIEDVFAPIEERIQPPVEQWLQGFCDAEFVVTDSFHACVFSIIFGKPFIVYGNAFRGLARFKSLLSIFKIEDNLILSLAEYSKEKGGLIVAEKIVKDFQKKGFVFLEEGLSCNA
jgi:hypothetical protein